MIYLILTILSSSCIAIFMRISEKYLKDKMLMFATNYIVCAILSLWYFESNILRTVLQKGFAFALGMGILCGILYLVSFTMLQYNIGINGVVLSSTFMKLGVLVPTLMAIFIFKEAPSILQIMGIILACIAIILIQFEKEEKKERHMLWLFLMLFIGGMTDSLANIYDKMGVRALKDSYLFVTFFVAFLCALILWIRNGRKFSAYDIVFGILIGIPNYYSARFLLLSLSKIPAMIAYPVYSTMTIILVSLCGVFFFKEKMNRKKCIAIAMILAALVMLS